MQKIFIILILLAFNVSLSAQEITTDTLPKVSDSLNMGTDTSQVSVDSLELKRPKSVVDFPIEYKCDDSMLISFDD